MKVRGLLFMVHLVETDRHEHLLACTTDEAWSTDVL